MFSTASTKILVNGSPGTRIYHAHGLRQGDPLSPMLFVLVMETLNALISAAESYNLLKTIDPKVKCWAFLYADDVVIFVQPEERQLVALRAILEVFAAASGLHSNVQKCQASPIQCDLNDTCTILQFFPCRLSPFPCKYLGIPLSIYKLSRADLQPLVDSVAARLPSWKAALMSRAGRKVLTCVTLSAIPVHTAIAVELCPWAIQAIDKLRRAFLWKGTASVHGGHCMVAWPKCCRPAELGGLGIPDLKLMGLSLRALGMVAPYGRNQILGFPSREV